MYRVNLIKPPRRRTESVNLNKMAEEIIEHFRENPNHGTDCSCMDKYVRAIYNATEIREWVWVPPTDDEWGPPEPGYWKQVSSRAQHAIDGVLYRAAGPGRRR